jgi:ubiquinone biosynthesis protein COQ4
MTFVQFHPIRALRAARALSQDPDDLPQVFTIIEALSGDTIGRIVRRMRSLASGRRLLEQKPDIVDVLGDRAALARLPEGSLGRAYLDFVTRENISAQGIRAAEDAGKRHDKRLEPPLDWMSMRMRDTHDLWHAATGYTGDVLGEASLLAFTFAQTKNPAIALIIGIALFKTAIAAHGGAAARSTIFDGFKRGLRAGWLPAQEWEQLLAMPLAQVREQLALGTPPVYTPVRSYELKPGASLASA